MRIGTFPLGDGPKWVCDPHRIAVSANTTKGCLVYSIGSNNDFSFETAVHDHISEKCEIHTFDPTVGASPTEKPDFVDFHPWGLGSSDEDGKVVLKTMPTLVKDLGHENRQIDIFKIDCEGCEWTTYKDWFGSGVNIKQVQVELHYGTLEDDRYAHLEHPGPVAHNFFLHLESLGYVIFHKEPNTLGCKGNCIEFSLIKMEKSFWNY